MGQYEKLKFRQGSHLIALVETPKFSTNKYTYDEELGFFRLKAALPAGFSFPYDFGLIPQTRGEDGDPLDVLILHEHATFAGCLVECRLLGSLHVKQREADGKTVRNDRFIAVAAESKVYSRLHDIKDLGKPMQEEIEHFFSSYAEIRCKKLSELRFVGREKSWKLIEAAAEEKD